MPNTQSGVVSAAALGKMKEADFISLIESELRDAYKAEQIRLNDLHKELDEKIAVANKEKSDIEANIIRDCQINLAMDDGFAQLAARFNAVTAPALFEPVKAPKNSIVVESPALQVFSASMNVTMSLVLKAEKPTDHQLTHPPAKAVVTFNMPIPENLQNVLNKLNELRKQQGIVRRELDKPANRNLNELARNVLAKARLQALTGSEKVFKPEALIQQLRQMV